MAKTKRRRPAGTKADPLYYVWGDRSGVIGWYDGHTRDRVASPIPLLEDEDAHLSAVQQEVMHLSD